MVDEGSTKVQNSRQDTFCFRLSPAAPVTIVGTQVLNQAGGMGSEYVKLWLLTQRVGLYCTEFLFHRCKGSAGEARGQKAHCS